MFDEKMEFHCIVCGRVLPTPDVSMVPGLTALDMWNYPLCGDSNQGHMRRVKKHEQLPRA